MGLYVSAVSSYSVRKTTLISLLLFLRLSYEMTNTPLSVPAEWGSSVILEDEGWREERREKGRGRARS